MKHALRCAVFLLLPCMILLPPAQGAGAPGKTPQAVVDRHLETRIRQTLGNDSEIEVEDLQVEVADGIVTLSGRSPSGAHKNLAARRAERLPGVSGVINLIEVQPGLRSLDGEAAPVER